MKLEKTPKARAIEIDFNAELAAILADIDLVKVVPEYSKEPFRIGLRCVAMLGPVAFRELESIGRAWSRHILEETSRR